MSQTLSRKDILSRSCLLTARNGADAPFVRKLWADLTFMRAFHRLAPKLPISEDQLVRILNTEYIAPVEKTRALHWVIRAPSGKPWGLMSLTDLTIQHGRAEVLLGVLPGAPFGMATAAMLMLFQFYFNEMKFNKLYSLVFVDNVISLKATLHLGFKQEGLFRQHTFDPERRCHVDVIQNGLLAEDAISERNIKLMERLLQMRPVGTLRS